MKVQRLIEKYKELYENVFDFGAKLACQLILQDLEQLDELETGHADEAPRYLKNILARLRELPDHDREVWLKAIMGEFKEDFSHVKWREGYEQGKLEGMVEPEKVQIPQFVADWIEYCKRGLSIRQAISQVHVGIEVDDWLMEVDADGVFVNQETFARAWLDGYEVEEEKRYVVKVKGICGNHETLNREKHSKKWLFSDREENTLYKTHHTRKELEEAGFGEVFNSPLFEIVEVE